MSALIALRFYIVRNCDPGYMREDDAAIYWKLHRQVYPEVLENLICAVEDKDPDPGTVLHCRLHEAIKIVNA